MMLLQKAMGSASGVSSSLTAGIAATLLGATFYRTSNFAFNSSCDNNENPRSSLHSDDTGFRIESHLMEKISQKSYLTSAKDQIPSTLRVLAIDIKEMRTEAFTGTCRLSHDKIFPEEVAPPKEISMPSQEDKDNPSHSDKKRIRRRNKMEIPQKALVKSIFHCSSPRSQQPIGVELLEASISDLNPYKLRKKQRIGAWEYDPGKYYESQSEKNNENQASMDEDNKQEIEEHRGSSGANDSRIQDPTFVEMEAPWNQYAWMEELRLRINGQVHFDAPMEKSSRYERVLFGHVYKTTVPAVHKMIDFFIPFAFAKSNPDGADSRNATDVRAGNRPHVVIANGAALQLVPSSLRLLQKLCKKADIPLFVVHDPRAWGGNTQASLEEALVAMRSTVKNKVINQALERQGSLAFTRGRMLGQAETILHYEIKEKKQRAKEMLGLDSKRRPKKEDWGQYDAAMLEKKLMARNVIKRDEADSDSVTYSQAMIELAKKCGENQAVHAQAQSLTHPVKADDDSEKTFPSSSPETLPM